MAQTARDDLVAPITSTMQTWELTVPALFQHGQRVHRRSEVVSFDGEGISSATFGEVAERAERLAGALVALGVGPGDRVGTLMWNSQEHLEAYFAVPGMGAVLHTLNLRLPAEDLAQIMAQAGDKVVLAHASLLPLMAAVQGNLPMLERVLVVNDPGQPQPFIERQSQAEYLMYEDVLAAAPAGFEWPRLDERSPAAICYTSGTTASPRGVVYSHRSTFLHALATATSACFAMAAFDRALPMVPMFHVNAWGIPYSAWMLGADVVMPHRWLLAGPACRLIKLARPTFACGVPTIWASLLEYANLHPDEVDFSSLRLVTSGGAALPNSIMESFRDRYGVKVAQGWGMTETSPVCTFSLVGEPGPMEGKPLSAGRLLPGVEMRAVTPDGAVAPWDGQTVGEIEVRGPWVTGSYVGGAEARQFHDGWLRTGDIGTIDEDGYLTLLDRLKDVIKSGGEWISSLRLENELMAHASVLEAAVIGAPDARWGERPAAFVARRPGADVTPEELAAHIAVRLPRWWAPDHWVFVDEIPKTTVGKYDKVALRERYRQSAGAGTLSSPGAGPSAGPGAPPTAPAAT